MKELGFWLYSTNVGQYFMKFNDDKARLGDVKKLYDVTPIHMLGISYFFPSKAVSQLLFFFSIKTERKTLRENSFFECLVVFSDDEALNEDFGKKRVRAPSLNPKKVRSHDDVRKGPKLKGVKSVTLPVSGFLLFSSPLSTYLLTNSVSVEKTPPTNSGNRTLCQFGRRVQHPGGAPIPCVFYSGQSQ